MGIFNLTPELLDAFKLFLIIVALFHFFAGLILIYQTNKMNSILKTSNFGCFRVITIFYLGLLLLILVLIILF